jgi:NADPH:quinone reductase-like Zn-dependent oxidoreductase
MRAIVLRKNGGVENLSLADVPLPVLKPGEVMVKVKAISINPVDTSVRQDHQRMMLMLKPEDENGEHILGWDIAGTVSETRPENSEWMGKDVFGMINFPGQGRAYAEYVAAPADQLAEKPSNVSFEEAAGATLAALTAWQALVSTAKIKKGDHVLIHAAAGGVGHYAVQIAKAFGATVSGTASAGNKDFVLGLGADNFIDYKNQQFEAIITDVDIVLDSIDDRNHLIRSAAALKPGGRLVSIKANLDDEIKSILKHKNISGYRILVKSDGNDMMQIAELMIKGALKTHISGNFPFENLPEAHLQIETRRTRGKITVTI